MRRMASQNENCRLAAEWLERRFTVPAKRYVQNPTWVGGIAPNRAATTAGNRDTDHVGAMEEGYGRSHAGPPDRPVADSEVGQSAVREFVQGDDGTRAQAPTDCRKKESADGGQSVAKHREANIEPDCVGSQTKKLSSDPLR